MLIKQQKHATPKQATASAGSPHGKTARTWRLYSLLFILLLLAGCASESNPREPQVMLTTVSYVIDESEVEIAGQSTIRQDLEMIVLWGPQRGEVLELEHLILTMAGDKPLEQGNWIYVRRELGPDDRPIYSVAGPARFVGLATLATLFLALALVIAGRRGMQALLGMVVSILILFLIALPSLSKGNAPLGRVLLGASLAMPALYLTAHGFRRETLVALVGSWIALAIVAALVALATSMTSLTGYAAEEMAWLQLSGTNAVSAIGLMQAGVLISVLGVLDDVTIAQASLVTQLSELDKEMNWRQLYQRAMKVGQDHIASMINTMVLVYIGASLPLVLLLTGSTAPLGYVISQELIAEEIVRTLVASSGLIIAVPVVTLLAALVVAKFSPLLEAQ